MSERKRSVSEDPSFGKASLIMNQNLLKKIYYDPKEGFQGALLLYKKAKAIDPSITHAVVRAFLKTQETQQLHSKKRKLKNFYPIVANPPHKENNKIKDHIWQTDLYDCSADAHHNSGVNFLLVVVNVYDRFLWVEPLKKKDNKSVTEAMTKIFESGRTPQIIQHDEGQEYNSRAYLALLKKYQITPSYNDIGDKRSKVAIVERMNGILRSLITKFCTANKTKRWIDHLQDFVYNRNNSPHISLGYSTPARPNHNKIQEVIEDKTELAQNDETEFEIGDKVRHIKHQGRFAKGANAKWTKEVFTISDKDGIRYQLQPSEKWYKYYDLTLANEIEEHEPAPLSLKKEEKIVPKKLRLALNKESVDAANITRGLRARKPISHTITNKGERVIY